MEEVLDDTGKWATLRPIQPEVVVTLKDRPIPCSTHNEKAKFVDDDLGYVAIVCAGCLDTGWEGIEQVEVAA